MPKYNGRIFKMALRKLGLKQPAVIVVCILAVFFSGCSSMNLNVVKQSNLSQIHTVAVFPFDSNRPAAAEKITQALAENLKKTSFEVVPAQKLAKMLDAAGLTLAQVSRDHHPALKRLKGVDAFIVGDASIRALGGYVEHVAQCQVRMIHAESGKVLLEIEYKTSSNSIAMQQVSTEAQIGAALAKKIGGL